MSAGLEREGAFPHASRPMEPSQEVPRFFFPSLPTKSRPSKVLHQILMVRPLLSHVTLAVLLPQSRNKEIMHGPARSRTSAVSDPSQGLWLRWLQFPENPQFEWSHKPLLGLLSQMTSQSPGDNERSSGYGGQASFPLMVIMRWRTRPLSHPLHFCLDSSI